MFRSRLLVLLALLPVGCSHPHPQTSNGPVAMPGFDQLPPADRDAFTAWKASILKSCDWRAAFPSFADGQKPDPDMQVLDVTALLAKTGGKAIVAGDHGEVLLLDTPQPAGSTGFDESSVTRTVNGQGSQWSFASQLSSDECVIKFQDKEVFRGPIAGRMAVTAYADADSVAAAHATVDFEVSSVKTATGQLDRVTTGALTTAALQALTPSAAAHKLLATKLGLSAADVSDRFPLATASVPAVAARVANVDGSWFAPAISGGDVVTGGADALAAFNPGPATTLSIEWLFVPPTIKAPSYDAGEAQRRWVLRTDLQIGARTGSGAKQSAAVQASGIHIADSFTLSDAAAARCFVGRADDALTFAEAANLTTIAPYDSVATACVLLTQDLPTALAGQDDAIAIIVGQAFADRLTLDGWDDAVVGVAARLRKAGADLKQKLIPAALPAPAADRVRTALGWLDTLAKGIAGDTTREAAFGDAIVRLAFTWSLRHEVVSAALVTEVAQAIVAAARYDVSVKTMLADVATDTDSGSNGERAAACGAGLISSRSDAIEALLERMSALKPLAAFSDAQRDAVLQSCWSDGAIGTIQASVAAAEQFYAADTAKGKDEYSYDDAARALLEHAVAAGWTGDTFAALGDVLDYMAPETAYCDGDHARATQARCVDGTLQKLDVLVSGKNGARYAGLARALRSEVQRGGLDFDVRYAVSTAFLDGVWMGCSDAQFSARQTWVVAQLDKIRQATDSDGGYQLLTDLRSGLQSCQ